MALACPAILADRAAGLCRAVDLYCERSSDAFWAEPLNALTNAAFPLAAFAAWWLARRASVSNRTIGALIAITFAIGIGSFLFHTLATAGAAILDVAPIALFMLLYLWLALRRFVGLLRPATVAWLVLFLLLPVVLGRLLPPGFLSGGIGYLPALLAMLAVGAVLAARRYAAAGLVLAAGGTFLVSLAFRTIDLPACGAWPEGTHFLWHVLNAVVLYLLLRAAILDRQRAQS
jgi:hypothetical protein